MVVDTASVEHEISSYIADVTQTMHIDKVYLYGSYAKGTQSKYSDVDICFFSSDFEGQRSVDILTRLLKLARNYQADIEPKAFPTSELDQDNPFVKEILRTGREITIFQ